MNYEMLARAKETPLTAAELDELNAALPAFDKYIELKFTQFSGELVEAEVEVHDGILQPTGIVNGGVLASIGETVGSTAGVMHANAPVSGVNNSADFLRPVSVGTIIARCEPVYLGRRTQLWRIELKNNEKLAAVCQLRTMVLEKR
ncbi:PaaI family thioesterase [Corynebacterium lubricantis]|uniref:PaaI family thioesterase n=1 Tax=Corynebacterium lubricantis TaxID=541095 RepID=UPI000399F544|nr:PaaI family thioesterase [Corynebacterium lubricantis]